MAKRVATVLVAAALGAATLAATPAYADDGSGQPSPSGQPTGQSTQPSPSEQSAKKDFGKKHYVPDPRILSVHVSPNPVVVKRRGSVQVTATVRTKDVRSVSIEVWEPSGRRHHGQHRFGQQSGEHDRHDGRARYDTASRSWTFTSGHKTGQWKVHVEAIGLDGKRLTADRGFQVKQDRWRPQPPKGPKATRIVGFDATPEPVRRGHKLTLQGKLQVARCYADWYYRDWNSYVSVHRGSGNCHDSRSYWHDWNRLGHQDIDVYFQASGTRAWKRVGTLKSNRDGGFYGKVRAYRSGTWAVKFDGARGLKGSEAQDYVKVVRW